MGIRGRDVRDDPLLRAAGTSNATTVALAPHEPPARDPLATVAVTAEIPPIPISAARATATTPAPVTRVPAPVPLRQAVWFLCFVLVVCGAGMWGLHSRPDWFAFLRNQVGGQIPLATPGSGSTPAVKKTHVGSPPATAPTPAAFRLAAASEQAGFVRDVYDTGTADYSVTVSTSALCWVVIKSPSNALGDAVEATEPPGFHQTVPATDGTVFVEVAAHGATITVSSNSAAGSNGKVIGTLIDAHVGDYTFQS